MHCLKYPDRMDTRKASALLRALQNDTSRWAEIRAVVVEKVPGEAKHAPLTSQQRTVLFNAIKGRYWKSLTTEEKAAAERGEIVSSIEARRLGLWVGIQQHSVCESHLPRNMLQQQEAVYAYIRTQKSVGGSGC